MWYFKDNPNIKAPITDMEAAARVRMGQIKPDDIVSGDGCTWVPASQSELFGGSTIPEVKVPMVQRSSSGKSIVRIIAALIVIGLLGYLGYRYFTGVTSNPAPKAGSAEEGTSLGE